MAGLGTRAPTNCAVHNNEIEHMINEKLTFVERKLGHATTIDPNQVFFADNVGAFNNNANRRTTRLVQRKVDSRDREEQGPFIVQDVSIHPLPYEETSGTSTKYCFA